MRSQASLPPLNWAGPCLAVQRFCAAQNPVPWVGAAVWGGEEEEAAVAAAAAAADSCPPSPFCVQSSKRSGKRRWSGSDSSVGN